MKRLDACSGEKVSVLLNELNALEKDLESIQAAEKLVTSQGTSPQQKIEFLIHQPTLKENLENFIAKPFKKSIDVVPYDLPRELNRIRALKRQKQELAREIR